MSQDHRRKNKMDMTISEQMGAICEKICDRYCKFPIYASRGDITQAELDSMCEGCPLNELGVST